MIYSSRHGVLVLPIDEGNRKFPADDRLNVELKPLFESCEVLRELPTEEPWDFEDVYGNLVDFFTYDRFTCRADMPVPADGSALPARSLAANSPPRRQTVGDPGSYVKIDLDLSQYDQIAQRFSHGKLEGISVLKSGIATRNARFNAMTAEIERVAIKSRVPPRF